MARTVLLAQIFNNPNSVPPLALNLSQTAPIYRVALTSGQLALVGGGGAGGYTYSATGLPAGLSLNTATGSITGTPTTIGHNIVTATVTDSATNTFTATFSVDVLSRISIAGAFQPVAEVGVSVSNTLAVSGATGTVSWSISASPCPGGALSFNTTTAILSGTPTSTGSWSGTVTASDSGTGDSVTYTFTQSIVAALHFIAAPQSSGSFATNNVQTLLFWVAGAPPYNLACAITSSIGAQATASPGPGPQNGQLQFSCNSAGSASLVTTVTDALGAVITATTALTFYAPNQPIVVQQTGVDVGPAGIAKLNFIGATVTDAGSGVRNVSGLQGPQGATGATGPAGSGGGGSNTIYFA